MLRSGRVSLLTQEAPAAYPDPNLPPPLARTTRAGARPAIPAEAPMAHRPPLTTARSVPLAPPPDRLDGNRTVRPRAHTGKPRQVRRSPESRPIARASRSRVPTAKASRGRVPTVKANGARVRTAKVSPRAPTAKVSPAMTRAAPSPAAARLVTK